MAPELLRPAPDERQPVIPVKKPQDTLTVYEDWEIQTSSLDPVASSTCIQEAE